MPGETRNGMQCAEFESLLSEAVDQVLTGTQLDSFQAHARVCPFCGPMFAEVEAGKHWLKSLAEVGPPTNLVQSILADTVGVDTARLRATPAIEPTPGWFLGRLRHWGELLASPVVGVVRQPRFAMSFGMAFFSLSIAMSVAGVKVSDVKQVDLRPSALKRSYYSTTSKVVKYYENIRFVYEIESRVREFKRATTPAEPGPEQKQKNPKNNTSGQPETQQQRNYSREENQPIMASAQQHPTVVMVTTNRRDV